MKVFAFISDHDHHLHIEGGKLYRSLSGALDAMNDAFDEFCEVDTFVSGAWVGGPCWHNYMHHATLEEALAEEFQRDHRIYAYDLV